MNIRIRAMFLSRDASILDAMRVIDNAPKATGLSGIAVIVDGDRKLLGVITDGDIRAAILRGMSMNDPIGSIMRKDPLTVLRRETHDETFSVAMRTLRTDTRLMDIGAGKIVVLDGNGCVEDVVSFFDVLRHTDVKSKSITVVGLGYVGLTLAIALADAGFTVHGVDTNEETIADLRDGNPHFFEKGLLTAYRHHLGNGLSVSNNLANATSDVYIISVGTPVDDAKRPVMAHVEAACKVLGKVLKRGDVVMLRSTVPVGTTRNVCLPTLETSSGLVGGRDFSLVFAPERTIAGNAIAELRSLPQVIGALDSMGMEVATRLFRELTPIIVNVDSLEAAEMVKLLNNSFRDHVFGFANEVAILCDRWGIDAFKVINAANEGYPRNRIPLPSPGVGGVCLKKDPHILVATAQEKGYEPTLLGRSRSVNESMPDQVLAKILRFFIQTDKVPSAAQILLAGFAFKGEPETSDLRDSSSLRLVELLRDRHISVYGYDPVVQSDVLRSIDGVTPVNIDSGFGAVDAVIVMNNHRSYKDWDLHTLFHSTPKPALLFDGWNHFHGEDVARIDGIWYSSLSIDHGWMPKAT